MKRVVLSLALALASLTAITTASAAVPELQVSWDGQSDGIVKVSADVPANSTWILEGANDPDGQWSQLVTLKPSGYQIEVKNAPQFLRLTKGGETGDAVQVFNIRLHVQLIGSTVKITSSQLPSGRWILQQSADLEHWSDRATFEPSGYQIDANSAREKHLSYRLVRAAN